jgi:hypothetical protein
MHVQTIEEIRRAWLLKLIEQHGTTASLNARLGRARNDATLAQIKNKAPNKSGLPRSMGSELAREIEDKLGLERGTLDHSPDLSQEAVAFAKAYQQLPPRLKLALQEHLGLAQLATERPESAPPQLQESAGTLFR